MCMRAIFALFVIMPSLYAQNESGLPDKFLGSWVLTVYATTKDTTVKSGNAQINLSIHKNSYVYADMIAKKYTTTKTTDGKYILTSDNGAVLSIWMPRDNIVYVDARAHNAEMTLVRRDIFLSHVFYSQLPVAEQDPSVIALAFVDEAIREFKPFLDNNKKRQE